MEFVKIPAGSFLMGSQKNEIGKSKGEGPQHKVTISRSFHLGKYEVTQREWTSVMGFNPSFCIGANNPVESVSWEDVQEFISKYNKRDNKYKYRLPSEAEWEYACRAGSTTRYHFGNDSSKLSKYAWHKTSRDNIRDTIHPVGQLKPNRWGLYDMYGNVSEYLQDTWHRTYKGSPIDGIPWTEGVVKYKSMRGGCILNTANYCRSASRDYDILYNKYKYNGFRLVKY